MDGLAAFPPHAFDKAVAIWWALEDSDRQQLVALYLARAGFARIETGEVVPAAGDRIWAVMGRAGG